MQSSKKEGEAPTQSSIDPDNEAKFNACLLQSRFTEESDGTLSFDAFLQCKEDEDLDMSLEELLVLASSVLGEGVDALTLEDFVKLNTVLDEREGGEKEF